MAESQVKKSAMPSFSLFPAFPQEVRQMIWVETIHPRIIPLDPSKCCRAHSLPVQPIPSRRSPPKCLPRFTVCDVDPVVALNVCKESRSAALIHGGYRAWKIANIDGETKDLMWSPALDVVTVMEPHDVMQPFMYNYLFLRQFHAQARELQRFALPTSHWSVVRRECSHMAPMWLDYANLKEVVVIVDARYESKCVRSLPDLQAGTEAEKPWVIPRDIEVVLKALISMRQSKNWTPPTVRVVRAYDGILAGHSEKWRLRTRLDPHEEEFMQLDWQEIHGRTNGRLRNQQRSQYGRI